MTYDGLAQMCNGPMALLVILTSGSTGVPKGVLTAATVVMDRGFDVHQSSRRVWPSWTALANRLDLVLAGRPHAAYLARIRVTCVLTVAAEM